MEKRYTTTHPPGKAQRTFCYIKRIEAYTLLVATLIIPISPIFAAESTSTEPLPVGGSSVVAPDSEPTDALVSEDLPTINQGIHPAATAPSDVTESVQVETQMTSTQEAVKPDVTTTSISPEDTLATTSVTEVIPGPKIDAASTTVDTQATHGIVDGISTSTVESDSTTGSTTIVITTTATTSTSDSFDGIPDATVQSNPDATTTITPHSTTTENVVSTTDNTASTSDTLDRPTTIQNPVTTHDITDSTNTQAINIVEVNSAINDQNRFQFSKDECVSVGDGSFYCTQPVALDTAKGTNHAYAATDEQGDREIYMERDGVVTKITNNQTDDDAPYYDKVSNTIVWQRLIDGRYQIMEYDFATDEEHQLTHERYNNMQPTREGSTILWQGWIGSDWEIMRDQNDVFDMLTDNDYHDIAPHINGNYIVWQAFEGNVWHVKVYDTRTRVTQTIGDDNGGSAQNPRFVLVYDTKMQNGDIETKGYDLESGKVVPLSSTPAPIPNDLPNPDPTDQNRAMVQQSVQVKTKSESEYDDTPVTLGGNGSIPPVAADESDIVVTSIDNNATSTSIATTTLKTSITPSANDLLVTSMVKEDKATSTDIEDVVVPAFEQSHEATTDSQGGVATST